LLFVPVGKHRHDEKKLHQNNGNPRMHKPNKQIGGISATAVKGADILSENREKGITKVGRAIVESG
jgi:hypothetical protein